MFEISPRVILKACNLLIKNRFIYSALTHTLSFQPCNTSLRQSSVTLVNSNSVVTNYKISSSNCNDFFTLATKK